MRLIINAEKNFNKKLQPIIHLLIRLAVKNFNAEVLIIEKKLEEEKIKCGTC